MLTYQEKIFLSSLKRLCVWATRWFHQSPVAWWREHSAGIVIQFTISQLLFVFIRFTIIFFVAPYQVTFAYYFIVFLALFAWVLNIVFIIIYLCILKAIKMKQNYVIKLLLFYIVETNWAVSVTVKIIGNINLFGVSNRVKANLIINTFE